jgi:replicative DNA helicase
VSDDSQRFRDDAMEYALLGAVLSGPSHLPIAAAKVSAADFALASHARIWSVLLALDAARRPVTLPDLESELRRAGRHATVAADVELSAMRHMRVSLATLESYAERVASNARARRVAAALALAPSLAEQDSDPDVFADAALAQVAEAAKGRAGLEPVSAVDAVSDLDAYVRECAQLRGQLRGVPTGLHDLDRLTQGLRAGHLVIEAGRPGMGKTALALCHARAAAESGRNVAMFSMEMSRRELVMRLCCADANIDSQDLDAGRLEPHQLADLSAAQQRFSLLPLTIFDQTPLRPEDVRATCLRLAARAPLGLVVVDYLGLFQLPVKTGREREDVLLGEAAKRMKELARELDCPVVLLCQLNRECEKRPNKRPMPSDLRDSGHLEAHADVILFVYRDEVYNPESDDAGVAEIIVAKQRGGGVGVRRVAFEKRYTRFGNLAADPDDWASAPPSHTEDVVDARAWVPMDDVPPASHWSEGGDAE